MKAVDLFAGLGGFTLGAQLAGVEVIWAANHWPKAVEYHALNHPEVEHVCQDLHQYDFGLVPDHDLALLSPCCQGHFPNNRNKPSHNSSRATAWAVTSLLEAKRPPFAIIENIPWFKRWPLFPVFCESLRVLGYQLAILDHDAADAGTPQNRRRTYVVATQSKYPIVLKLPKREHVGIEQVIDWSRYSWRPVAEKCRKTQDRVANGWRDFGERFVMPYYSQGSGLTGRSLSRPLGTITTAPRWGLVNGKLQRMLQVPELVAAMSFPPGYQMPRNSRTATHFLGNAVAPFQARDIIEAVRAAA